MSAMKGVAVKEPKMQAITTIGLDIAKSVFQVHAIDAEGNVIIRRQLKRPSGKKVTHARTEGERAVTAVTHESRQVLEAQRFLVTRCPLSRKVGTGFRKRSCSTNRLERG